MSRITAAHTRSFETAPAVGEREAVSFDHFDAKNPHWFFGRDQRGVEGYFPAAGFEVDEEARTAVSRRAYDAMELTVSEGDEAEILESYPGWVRVRVAGETGWIPAGCLAID